MPRRDRDRPSPHAGRRARAVLALALVAALTGCTASRKLADPILILETDGGRELGVSTQFGVVFLGRTARSGPVMIAATFGDGPGIESSVIEPLGGGLYTAETEIRLPVAPMTFNTPGKGHEVIVKGRRGRETWRQETRVLADPDVDGILLPTGGELSRENAVGAGVYVRHDGVDYLVGLVSGELVLEGPGGTRRYVTVVGPEDLWRLVTFRREYQRKRRWVYREDIL